MLRIKETMWILVYMLLLDRLVNFDNTCHNKRLSNLSHTCKTKNIITDLDQ